MRRTREDRGAATVLAVGVVGVLLALGSALGVVAAAVVDHRRAQSAADLAALAGAAGGGACAEAARVARGNGARLVACRAEGRVVEVEVLVDGPRWRGLGADLRGRARAGPVG